MSKQILALAMIAALVPQGEEFKPEAVNEGVWLTEAHLTGIEGALAGNAAAATKAANELSAANTAKTTAEASLATANNSIAENKTTIANLEAEILRLKGSAAATFQATTTTEDTPVVAGKTDKKTKYHTSFDEMASKY